MWSSRAMPVLDHLDLQDLVQDLGDLQRGQQRVLQVWGNLRLGGLQDLGCV